MSAIMFMHVPRDGNGPNLIWRVGELLDKARIELPKHHADRFRQYVEDALDRLQRDGLIAHWQYERDVSCAGFASHAVGDRRDRIQRELCDVARARQRAAGPGITTTMKATTTGQMIDCQ
jgi:hypothetical protein